MTRYRRVLEAFFGFYAPVETQLKLITSFAPPLGFPLHDRASLLQRDLLALQLSPQEIADLPRCTDLPRIDEPGYMAGCLYVLEGASLGGRIIAQALNRELGLRVDNGAAFFVGDAGQTGMRWKRVLQWLDEVANSRARGDEIVAAACGTFSALARWARLKGLSR